VNVESTHPGVGDVSGRLRQVLNLDATAPAIHGNARWDNWGDIDAMRKGLVPILADLPSDVAVGLVARNRVEVVEALIALLASGRAVLMLNEMQQDHILRDEVQGLRPAVVIASAQDWARPGLLEAVGGSGSMGVCVYRGPDAHSEVTARRSAGAGRAATLPPGVAVNLKTSGTTGPPKRVNVTYAGLTASLDAVRQHHEPANAVANVVKLRAGTTIQMLSLAHVSSLQSICVTVTDGRRLVLLDRFEPVAWAEAVRDHAVVTTGLPPAALKMVLSSDIPPAWLSSLRSVRVGSAPISDTTASRFEELYGTAVLRAYGATEFQGIASWTMKDHQRFRDEKKGAVGRIHPGVEVRVVDAGNGAVKSRGETGVLEVRTRQAAASEDSWVRTSDLAHTDEDGFLWVDGRADGAINRGGFKIDPSEVRAVLCSEPRVADAAVIAAPDPRLGQVPIAVVKPKNWAAAPDEEDLRRWTRSHLEPYKVPLRVLVVSELPLTAAMKPDRQAILDMLGMSDE
jgi:long-chain acyl-CoA synthetase